MVQALLDGVARMGLAEYDPNVIIGAVNELQPLGKQQALDRIESYLNGPNVDQTAPGLFLLLRVLFDLPEGQPFPPVRLGQPTLAAPADPAKLPRFPIVLVNDVPLLLVRGYMLSGFPEPVKTHLAYFRTHGSIRTAPLTPSSQASGIAEAFRQQWQVAYGTAVNPDVQSFIETQIARFAGS